MNYIRGKYFGEKIPTKMNIEQIQKLLQQMAASQALQDRLMQQNQELIQQLALQPHAQGAQSNRVHSLHKELSYRIKDFVYNAEDNSTFDLWYSRYMTIFETQAVTMTDPEKLDLLTEKLNYSDYTKFANTILPLTKSTIPFTDAVKELKRIFGKKESQFAIRYKCIKTSVEPGEELDTYAARVNLNCEKFQIAKCSPDDFKVLVFVQGLNTPEHAHTLEKLLSKLDEQEKKRETTDNPDDIPKLKLQDVVNIASRLSALKVDKSMVQSPTPPPADVMQLQTPSWRSQGGKKFNRSQGSSNRSSFDNASRQNNTMNSSFRSNFSTSSRASPPSPCHHCGENHFHKDCPFRNQACKLCKVIGHKEGFCVSSFDFIKSQNKRSRKRSLQVQADSIASRKYVEPSINNQKITLQVDCGSDLTIISEVNHRLIGSPKLLRSNKKVRSACGGNIDIVGKFKAQINFHGRQSIGEIYVASSNLNVFGSDCLEALNLWTIPFASFCNKIEIEEPSSLSNEVVKKFPELFSKTLGLCNKTQASLTLKPGTKPIYRRARPVPFAAADAVENELKRLQLLGVITPIDYSEFAAPIVVVKKSENRIRICADYSTGLNDALEPNKHPLPTPEAIHSKLSQFKVFSKIDLSDAFLQIELDEEAKKLLTINTHIGLFKVNRLQPGVKTAPGLFQQVQDTLMSGAKGVFPYLDDYIVGGKDEKEHRENLFEGLKRLHDAGFHLKIEKCSFGQPQLTFLGLLIDKNGSRPDPEKIATLKAIPPPTDVKQLQAFLGGITWYGKFVGRMKELRGPLDELLCKDVDFQWQPHHQKVFEELKNVLSSDLALTHYNPRKKIIVAADASSYGMGAVIMHQMADGSERPILHAASSFTKAEKNYPQIQKEALALTFAVKKFHRYIYGRKFELRTDHQPLLAIFGSKEGISAVTASRLQRYALILLAYDFTIKYIDTNSFAYADFISRLVATHERSNEEVVIAIIKAEQLDSSKAEIAVMRCEASENLCFAMETAKKHLPVSFECIQEETCIDPELKQIAEYCKQGWPREQKHTNSEVAPFFKHRKEITVDEGVLFFQHRTIIPKHFRSQVLKELHDGHPGVERMKLIARSKVYWPSIDTSIEETVRSCESCATNAKSPIKCTLSAWPTPKGPWSRIHIDYAGPVDGYYYLVIVDAFSNWIEIFKMSSTTTQKTIERLEEVFARHGLVDTIVSDNGTQFTSDLFETFCVVNGIQHIKTAPYHPQSNGRAERNVALLKDGLKKLSGDTDGKLRKFLFFQRRTPSYALGGKSSHELMTGRCMKTKLDLLKPTDFQQFDRNEKMQAQFDKHHGAKLKNFHMGEEILAKIYKNNKWTWTSGTVIAQIGNVNYNVRIDFDGSRHKFHANQLKKRYHDLSDTDPNILMEHFEINVPGTVTIQPIPLDDTINESEEENNLDDEETESVDSYQSAEETVEEEPEPVRRLPRSTAGNLPARYNDYVMN